MQVRQLRTDKSSFVTGACARPQAAPQYISPRAAETRARQVRLALRAYARSQPALPRSLAIAKCIRLSLPFPYSPVGRFFKLYSPAVGRSTKTNGPSAPGFSISGGALRARLLCTCFLAVRRMLVCARRFIFTIRARSCRAARERERRPILYTKGNRGDRLRLAAAEDLAYTGAPSYKTVL